MHSLKNNNKTTCLLSHLLSRVTATSRGFHIKCSVCPPCCWTTHSSQRRHWPMARLTKRCDSLLHSVLQNCNELSTLINYSWKSPPPQNSIIDRILIHAVWKPHVRLEEHWSRNGSLSSPASVRCRTFHKVVYTVFQKKRIPSFIFGITETLD